jgi:hypothetical protein
VVVQEHGTQRVVWRVGERSLARCDDVLAERAVPGDEEAVVRGRRVDTHEVEARPMHDVDAT